MPFSGRCRDVNNSWGDGSCCCSGRDGGTDGYVKVWRLVATAAVANMNPALAVTMATTRRVEDDCDEEGG